MEAAELSEILFCSGPLTVLAPNDAAFESIDEATMNELLLPENREKLQNILLYHILPGLKLSEALGEGLLETLLDGQSVEVSSLSPVTFNQRSEVLEVDLVGCNGNLIVVSDLLIPGSSTICLDRRFSPISIQNRTSAICSHLLTIDVGYKTGYVRRAFLTQRNRNPTFR